MRILCLHGRGSNNQIFRMQTAGFRSLLPEYEFEFVQGQMPHTEGNWSLFTKEFSSAGLWGYFNMLDLADVLETERQLLDLVARDGPFDGILGYSQGATLAAQVLIRHSQDHTAHSHQAHATGSGNGRNSPPFKFAIFFNGATPSRVLELASRPEPVVPDLTQPLALKFLRAMKANPLLGSSKLYTAEAAELPSPSPTAAGLVGRRLMLTDGVLGMVKCDAARDGTLIQIPTLHVRCPTDEPEHGAELFELCEKRVAVQYFHNHKHDFPRGYDEMRQIARLIREVVGRAVGPDL